MSAKALSADGTYTVCVRFKDSKKPNVFLHFTLSLPRPRIKVDGLQATVTRLGGVKCIRRALGEFSSVSEIKTGPESRAYTAKDVLKGLDSYTLNFKYDGVYTVAIQYENGYTYITTVTIEHKEPVVTQNGKTLTMTGLDGLQIIRYAPGTYTTSGAVKNAQGCVSTKRVVNDTFTVTLSGTYTFLVQYTDGSANIMTFDFE